MNANGPSKNEMLASLLAVKLGIATSIATFVLLWHAKVSSLGLSFIGAVFLALLYFAWTINRQLKQRN